MASGGNQEEEEYEGSAGLGFRLGSEDKKGALPICSGQVGSNPSAHKPPWHLSPDELENWYKYNIDYGTDVFRTDCQTSIIDIVKHIQEETATRNSINNHTFCFDVNTVVKGGSFEKGTMVEGLSDVDLVVFDNNAYLQPIAEIGKERYKRALSNIISHLQLIENAEPQEGNKYLVKYKIKVRNRGFEVNLLPTTERNVRHFQHVYRNMFQSMLDVGTDDVGRETREFYYASFVQHQVQFVRGKPRCVKELIRLVKYWASKYLPEQFQKSYPLELITIDRWEKARKPNPLDKAQGLKSVLKVLANLDSLCVYWNYMPGVDENLNKTIIERLDMKGPIILDPANPTNNVGGLYQTDASGLYWQDAGGFYRQDAGGLYQQDGGTEYLLKHKEVIKYNATTTLQTALLRDVRAW